MLTNLKEIIGGDVTHAAVNLWSEEFSEAEAAAIHSRGQGDPRYREDLEGLLGIVAAMEGLAGDGAMQGLTREHRRLLHERRVKRRLALGMAAGILAVLGAVLAVFSPWTEERALPMHFTRIGEQQAIELDDGSVVTLNTGSQLVVDYSGPNRRILLDRGEAYFEVADDPERPFTVDLGLRSVTAVGTAFNVRKEPEHYSVAVIEGAVVFHSITDDPASSSALVSADKQGADLDTREPIRVEAGWVAEFDLNRDVLTTFRPDSMERYEGWRSGELAFYSEPLYRVIQELNRYSSKRILIEDASIMDLRVSTVIGVSVIDTALNNLEQVLPVEVTRLYDRIVITASAGN